MQPTETQRKNKLRCHETIGAKKSSAHEEKKTHDKTEQFINRTQNTLQP